MTIDGIIILDASGRPLIQSAFRTSRTSYALQHMDALNDAFDKNPARTVDPVLYVESSEGPSACCHVAHGNVRIACPVRGEMDPSFVFAFLRTFLDILQEYLGDVTAGTIRENFDTVYQLLEEMLDNGQPVTTEPNALREIVIPPSFFNKVLAVAGAAGLAKSGPAPFSSAIPWRSANVRYNNNEVFFDFVEELDAIMNSNGGVVTSQVWGKVKCTAKLSGTPDILLTFANPSMLQDCGFHPCVRLQRWIRDKTLSFVPPDGNFTLMDYRLGSALGSASATSQAHVVPFTMNNDIEISENGGSLDLSFVPRLLSTSRTLENVCIQLFLGDGATGANCMTTGAGGWMYDVRERAIRWSIPIASPSSTYTLRGTFTSQDKYPRISTALNVTFQLNQTNFSALKLQDLKVTREAYKPFRGVRSKASGKVDVRW